MKQKQEKKQEKPKPDIQYIINNLIEKYGSNLPEWANYKEILSENNLEIVDIYPEMLEIAKQRVLDRQNSCLEWDLQKEEGSTGASIWFSWTTKCNRYRVYKICRPVKKGNEILYGSCYLDKNSWDSIEHNKMGAGYPKYYDSPEDAFSAVEIFHASRINKSTVRSNKEEVIPKPIVEEILEPIIIIPPEPQFMKNPVSHVIRVLGSDAWNFEDTYQVVKFLGIKVSQEDIKKYLKEGMLGEGDKANLTQNQVERIYEVLEQL